MCICSQHDFELEDTKRTLRNIFADTDTCSSPRGKSSVSRAIVVHAQGNSSGVRTGF